MGRRRKPKDMQKAHLTQAEKERREEEERTVSTGNEQLKTPPEWLFNRTAKAEWRRITKELQKIEVVGNLDKANLAGDCNAYRMMPYEKLGSQIMHACEAKAYEVSPFGDYHIDTFEELLSGVKTLCRRDEKICGALWNDSGRAIKGSSYQGR